jgi:hypothetical protein
MFGIDIGINVSSITCISGKNEVLDYLVLFGKADKGLDWWLRVSRMADHIVIGINDLCRGMAGKIVDPLVSIEEPIFSYANRNARSHLILSCLYALVRTRLEKRGFTIYTVHPISAKSTARRLAFGDRKIKSSLVKKGKTTKEGMIRAFTKITGNAPNYPTKAGRETIADSYFIARTGLDKRRLGIND